MKVTHLSQGRGWNVQLSVPREKHVNTTSFQQPLMDVVRFSGQRGSPRQRTVITYLKGSWLLQIDCLVHF